MFSPGGGQLSEHVLPGLHAWGAAVTSTGDPRPETRGTWGTWGSQGGAESARGNITEQQDKITPRMLVCSFVNKV